MAKAWLILFDILLHLLLFVSFIFFYFNPPAYTHLKKTIQKSNTTSKTYCPEPTMVTDTLFTGTLPILGLDLNATLTLDDLIAMGQKCSAQEYFMTDVLISRTLDEGLNVLSAKRGDPVFIRIFKEEAILEVWIHTGTVYEHLKSYYICAASGDLGPKLKEGDKQAPEGFYSVKKSQLNPHSKYHLSFNLGYPNKYDRTHGRTGSFLMVHGNCVSIGCYAMTDEKIEEIYALVDEALKHGQKQIEVHAYPFYMTNENLAFYEGNKWYDFWLNLKEGYDYFEVEQLPPRINVEKKRYEIYESIN